MCSNVNGGKSWTVTPLSAVSQRIPIPPGGLAATLWVKRQLGRPGRAASSRARSGRARTLEPVVVWATATASARWSTTCSPMSARTRRPGPRWRSASIRSTAGRCSRQWHGAGLHGGAGHPGVPALLPHRRLSIVRRHDPRSAWHG